MRLLRAPQPWMIMDQRLVESRWNAGCRVRSTPTCVGTHFRGRSPRRHTTGCGLQGLGPVWPWNLTPTPLRRREGLSARTQSGGTHTGDTVSYDRRSSDRPSLRPFASVTTPPAKDKIHSVLNTGFPLLCVGEVYAPRGWGIEGDEVTTATEAISGVALQAFPTPGKPLVVVSAVYPHVRGDKGHARFHLHHVDRFTPTCVGTRATPASTFTT